MSTSVRFDKRSRRSAMLTYFIAIFSPVTTKEFERWSANLPSKAETFKAARFTSTDGACLWTVENLFIETSPSRRIWFALFLSIRVTSLPWSRRPETSTQLSFSDVTRTGTIGSSVPVMSELVVFTTVEVSLERLSTGSVITPANRASAHSTLFGTIRGALCNRLWWWYLHPSFLHFESSLHCWSMWPVPRHRKHAELAMTNSNRYKELSKLLAVC